MITNSKAITSLCTAAMISIVVAGCGGGGNGASSTIPAPNNVPTSPQVTSPVVAAPVIAAPSLQTTVPAPTYAAGSHELAYFNTLNAFRKSVGLGYLAQNTKLDLAAKNHLAYVQTNFIIPNIDYTTVDPATGKLAFHVENPVKPGFTGVTAADRARFAGYASSSVGEEGSFGNGGGGVAAVNALVNTVFHRDGLMAQGPADMGVAIGTDTFQTLVVNFGILTTAQKQASDFIGVYPVEGQTVVPLYAGIEAPNPFPEITLAQFSTNTGYPISIVAETSVALVTTSFTVTEEGQSTALNSRVLVKGSNEQTKLYLGENSAYLVAKSPFKPKTRYNVRFSGTAGAKAISRTWSFTTA